MRAILGARLVPVAEPSAQFPPVLPIQTSDSLAGATFVRLLCTGYVLLTFETTQFVLRQKPPLASPSLASQGPPSASTAYALPVLIYYIQRIWYRMYSHTQDWEHREPTQLQLRRGMGGTPMKTASIRDRMMLELGQMHCQPLLPFWCSPSLIKGQAVSSPSSRRAPLPLPLPGTLCAPPLRRLLPAGGP